MPPVPSEIYLKFIFWIPLAGFLPSLQLFCDFFKITVKTRPGITSEIDPKVYPSDFFCPHLLILSFLLVQKAKTKSTLLLDTSFARFVPLEF